MSPHPLVERVATKVAAAYAKSLELPESVFALLLILYFDGGDPGQLGPPAITLPTGKLEWCAEHGRLSELFIPWDPPEFAGDELDIPSLRGDADVVALYERVLEDIDLLDEYAAALAVATNAKLGVLVIAEGPDDSATAERAQLVAQLTPTQLEQWTANDWLPRDRRGDAALAELDVVLSQRVDSDRVAAVFRRDGTLYGRSPLWEAEFARKLKAHPTKLGDDPHVLGGLLPEGAVGVRVQDLFDVWHNALAGGGAWMVVLPHAARGGAPPGVIIDAAGTEAALEAERSDFVTFSSGVSSSDDWTADDEERWLEDERAEGRAVIEGTTVPLLWPVGAPRPPRLGGWGGAGARVRATSG